MPSRRTNKLFLFIFLTLYVVQIFGNGTREHLLDSREKRKKQLENILKNVNENLDDHRSGKVVVDLVGRINKCGVISPRFDVALPDIEQLASNILPSRQFGHLVLTTPYGIMTHEEARRKNTGGKIVGFFF